MKPNNHTILFFLVFLLNACASYRLHLSKEAEAWKGNALPEQQPVYKFYLIGDAGGAEYGKALPALSLLDQKLKSEPQQDKVAVLFLGDNIYPNGMPDEDDLAAREERLFDEYKLKAQLDVVKDFEGRVHFLAGNHDWYGYGVDGVEEQEAFIDEYLDRDEAMEPNPGCGDPKEIELRKDLTLILLDSQWFLENWQNKPEINEGCDVKSRSAFALQFEEVLKGNRNKNVLIAMHHPIYTYGPHGGGFTLKDHLFPLTAANKALLIPLPVIGSIYPFFRSAIGTNQDIVHPKYKEFRDLVLNSARKNGNFMFASGHEHSLQYIERSGQSFIVSGAGSRKSPVRLGDGSDFAYAAPGFSELLIYEDGSVWVQFWVAQKEEKDGQLVFRKKIREPLPKSEDIYQDSLFLFKIDPEKAMVSVPVTDRDYTKKGLGKKLWGAHYREAYAQEITVPQLDLTAFKGGVEPVKRGGGYQTNSLRLETQEGRQYTMRSVKKDPTRTVPYPFNQTFILDIVQDNFSAAHPMAATVIPPLADAVGIYHTNPRLYYVPKQPALKYYNEGYGDALYLVEERPDEDVWQEADFFGNPDDILSTSDMLEEIRKDQDHSVDDRFVVRNRLFDNVLGDWDRHDDQWRWADFEDGKYHLYRPIPRDRDQAFSRYDGWILGVFRQFSPMLQPLRAYDYDIKPIRWSNFGARYFDPSFMSRADWEDWKEEALFLQEKLTDEVIDRAFEEHWPEKFIELDAGFIKARLKSRRDKLLDIARRLYLHNARHVEIVGTNDRELVEIQRKEGGLTEVKMFALSDKKGKKQELLYERTFLPEETKEIQIFTMEDDDLIRISGTARNGPLLRILGGEGEDTFYDESIVGGGKKTIIYDVLSEDRQLKKGKETRLKLTDNPFYNLYDRKDKHHEFNFGFAMPTLSFNPDDGVLLGALASFTNQGFKKEPYANSHALSFQYAAATSGLKFEYTGDFIDVFGAWDVQLDALLRSPLYTSNFYGLGNETINTEDENGVDFHRLRLREYSFFAALMRKQYSSFFTIGPEFEDIRVERTAGRFIDLIGDELDPEMYDGVKYLGLKTVVDFENVNSVAYPSRGIHFQMEGGWKMQLEDNSRNFPYLEASLAVYQQLDREGVLVLASRVGGKQIFNGKFEFFQSATLGGIGPGSNIRGFRRDRFAGQSSFYHNTDLRLQLLASPNRAVPFVFGIFGGFDYGRVWLEGDGSNLWHTSAGGGVFISPFNLATISLGVFKGDDADARVNFGGGFFF